MKTLTISRKLALLTVALIGAGVGIAAYLMMRTDKTVAGYERVVAQQLESRRQAVELQLALKNVVKEWKNLLIHGHDADGDKYLGKLSDAQPLASSAAATSATEMRRPIMRSSQDEI